MALDVLTLARIQFAFTIMFHYLFPPLSIGLGCMLVVMEGLYLATRNPVYERMARFWTRIFAVNFAMGVTTGIVMEFEFGTNWATYSRYVGDVFGSALAAEGIFAFFLESGFLAVLVFGWDRVGPRVHFLSTCMVALGAMFSAVWIVVANSWQQTPAGFVVRGEGLEARAEITDFWAMVFNPSSVHRLTHVLIGALILGAFFVLSITAYYLLRGRHLDVARKCLPIALAFALVSSLAAVVSGHFQAHQVARTQPAKLAAFEGHYRTGPAPLWLFGVPDDEAETVRYGVGIPGMLGFLVHGDPAARVTGLDAFRPEDRPPVGLPFQAYHLMVAIGMANIALAGLGVLYYWRGTLLDQRWLLWTYVFWVAGPYLANQAGWVAAEVGRQPWVVYGLLRTSDALSKSVTAGQVLGSILMFLVIYTLLFFVYIYVLNDKIHAGPEQPHPVADRGSFAELVDAAASLVEHGTGRSLTEAHDESAPPDAGAPRP